jgi:hypothetical protein
MQRSASKTFSCLLLLASLWASNAWSQAPLAPTKSSTCQSTLEAAPVGDISIKELASFGPAEIVSKGNYTMIFWPFDPEERPMTAGKTAVGFALIRTGDLGEQPVGLMILSTQSNDLDFVKDGNQILIGSGPQGGCPTRAILSVTETGGVVLRELAVEKGR